MAKNTVLLCLLATFTTVLCSLTISTLDVDENYYDVDYDSTQRSKRDVAQSEHIIWRDNRETVKFGNKNGTQTIKRVVHHGIYPSLEIEVPIGGGLNKNSVKDSRTVRSVPEGDQHRTYREEGEKKPQVPVRITYQAVYPPEIHNSSGSSPYLRAQHPPTGSDVNYYTRQRVKNAPPTGNRTQYRTLYFPEGRNFTGDPLNKGRVRLVSAAYYSVNGSRDDLRSFSNLPANVRRISGNESSIRRQRNATSQSSMPSSRSQRDASEPESERVASIRKRRNLVSTSEQLSSIRSRQNVISPVSERLSSTRSRRNIVSPASESLSSIRSRNRFISPVSERLSSIRRSRNIVSPESERMSSIRSRRNIVSPVSERLSSIKRRRNILSPASEQLSSIRRRRNIVSPVSEWLSSKRSRRNILSPASESLSSISSRNSFRSPVSERLSSIRRSRNIVSPSSERLSSIRRRRNIVSPESERMSSIRRRRNIVSPVSERISSIRSRRNIVSPESERISSIRSRRNIVSPASERMSSIRTYNPHSRIDRSDIDAQLLNWVLADSDGAPSQIELSNRALPGVNARLVNQALSTIETLQAARDRESIGGVYELDHAPELDHVSELDYASELDRERPHYRQTDAKRWKKRQEPDDGSKSSDVGDWEFPQPRISSKSYSSKKHRKLPNKLRKSRKRRLKNLRKRQNGESVEIGVRSRARRRRDIGSWKWLDGFFGYEGTAVVVQKCKNRPKDVDDDSKMEPPVDCFILIQAPPRKVYCKPPRRYAMGRCRPVL